MGKRRNKLHGKSGIWKASTTIHIYPEPSSGYSGEFLPKCKKLTYVRKFALLIHISDFGLVTLRKSSRYCPKCELIVTHQDELEHELVLMLINRKHEEDIGKPYLVIGTVDLKAWKQFMVASGTLEQVLIASSDFKK